MLNIRERITTIFQNSIQLTTLFTLGLTILGLLLRLSLRFDEIHWYTDAYVYAQSARYLLLGRGLVFKTNGMFYIPWIQPWYSIFIAFFYLLLGVSDQSAILCTIFFGTATIPLIYFLGRSLFNEWVGLFSAILIAFSPFHILSSSTILSDVPSMFFVTLTVTLFYVGYNKCNNSYLALAGIAMGTSIMIRPTNFLIYVVLGCYLLVKDRLQWIKSRHVFIGFITSIITLIPVLLRNYSLWGNPFLTSYQSPYLTESVPYFSLTYAVFGSEHTGASHLLMHLQRLFLEHLPVVQTGRFPLVHWQPVFYLTIFFIVGMIYLFRERSHKLVLLCTWLLVYLGLFSCYKDFVRRYAFTFFPAICIFTSYGFFKTGRRLLDRFYSRPYLKKGRLTTVFLVSTLSCIILMGLPTYSYEIESVADYTKNPEFGQLFNEVGVWVSDHTEQNSIIVAMVPYAMEFYSRRDMMEIDYVEKMWYYHGPPAYWPIDRPPLTYMWNLSELVDRFPVYVVRDPWHTEEFDSITNVFNLELKESFSWKWWSMSVYLITPTDTSISTR